MNGYGWALVAQTLLALAALGIAGGWLLQIFRRDDRPFFWLAAPLTGLFTLGGSLVLLYFGARLSFSWCLSIGFAINAAATLFGIVRPRTMPQANFKLIVPILAAGIVACWTTASCNKTALECREPTIEVMEGSDMFGYAMVADWLREHPASRPPRQGIPFESLAFNNIHREGSRPVTFMLAAAAAEVRGTDALFSYDWASGVILGAAILGGAAAFASNRPILLLLIAGIGTSSLLTNARTGFMGKSVAYPGALLLAAFFLETLERPNRWRYAATIGFHGVLAFCLNPIFPVVAFALLLPGYALAVGWDFAIARWNDRLASVRTSFLRPILSAVGLAATALPLFIIHRVVYGKFMGPPAPEDWAWVIPVSLDLEKPSTLPELQPETLNALLIACAASLIIAMVAALVRRNRTATALICSSAIVPVMWAIGDRGIFFFQALLYPFTLVGIASLAQPWKRSQPIAPTTEVLANATPSRKDWSRWSGAVRVAAVALLLAVSLGLRIPQFLNAADRYVFSVHPYRVLHCQSDVQAFLEAIGSDEVDVSLWHYADNHWAWAELAARGVPVQMRSPAWDVTLRSHYSASLRDYDGPRIEYDLFAPKARFSLVERNVSVPTSSERLIGKRLKLVEDRSEIALVGIARHSGNNRDRAGRPCFFIGREPAELLISNGTGCERAIQLRFDIGPLPGNPVERALALNYRIGGESGSMAIQRGNEAIVPLRLAPGLNKVELNVSACCREESITCNLAPIELQNLRIEPAGESDPSDRQ